jgi:hypothetical protein
VNEMAARPTAPSADLEAFDYAMRAPFALVATELIDILGAKLVAYIAGVRETRAIQQYADDSRSPRHPAIEPRLRLALRIARLISKHDGKEIAQAWFTGLNPRLNDRSPARLLREGEIDEVGPDIIAAARSFIVGG